MSFGKFSGLRAIPISILEDLPVESKYSGSRSQTSQLYTVDAASSSEEAMTAGAFIRSRVSSHRETPKRVVILQQQRNMMPYGSLRERDLNCCLQQGMTNPVTVPSRKLDHSSLQIL